MPRPYPSSRRRWKICTALYVQVSSSRVMRGLKGSRRLPRDTGRRGSKCERADHLATVLGWRCKARAVCATVRRWRSRQSRILQNVSWSITGRGSGCCRPRQWRRWRECPAPGVAIGRWCGRWDLLCRMGNYAASSGFAAAMPAICLPSMRHSFISKCLLLNLTDGRRYEYDSIFCGPQNTAAPPPGSIGPLH